MSQDPTKPQGTMTLDLNAPLPTERDVATVSGPRKYNHNDSYYLSGIAPAGGMGDGATMPSQPHSVEYYEKWRQEKQDRIDRGEDPWTDFEQRAKEAREKTLFGRMAKAFKGSGKDKDKDEQKVVK